MSTLVEWVPNFSEGRDTSKVDAIIDARKVPGDYLVDHEMDSDQSPSASSQPLLESAPCPDALSGLHLASRFFFAD